MMSSQEKRRPAPYGTVRPGWEAIGTGEKSETVTESADKNSHVIEKWGCRGRERFRFSARQVRR